ncbi:MAG: hypothetical protein ACOCPW_01245 [Marinilabiliaceae bacterium]
MSLLPVVLLLGVLAPAVYYSVRKAYPALVRKKATKQLEPLLFPNGNRQKSEIIKCCKELTDSRFSDEEILDYFMKMKGLQIVNTRKANFWLKKYLFTPAPIKLNYFEQVKFYDLFLNFPENENTSDHSKAKHNREYTKKEQEKNASPQLTRQEKPV